jgi:hypothetical protein
MKLATFILLAALSLGTARASDFTGVYGLIDKVVFEPNADKPERIQVFGVFAIARTDDRNLYQPAQRGYLYFTLPNAQRDLALREWSDLKAKAGTHTMISFGRRSDLKAPTVRKTDVKLASPDEYTLGIGLVAARSDTDYAPVKSVLEAQK